MRLAIIAVIALLVLGGGAAGVYFYFLQPAEASAGEEAEDGHGDEHAKAKSKDGHGGHGGSQFVELDPLVLPIVDNNGVNQTVSMVVALEVADQAAAAEVEKMEPKLKDAYIQDMYGVLNEYAALKGGVIQVSKIKNRLNKITTDIMGDDVVQDVLLQVVQQRPI